DNSPARAGTSQVPLETTVVGRLRYSCRTPGTAVVASAPVTSGGGGAQGTARWVFRLGLLSLPVITVDPPSDVVDEALVDTGDFIEVNPARKIVGMLAFQEKVHRGGNDPQLIGESQPDPFDDGRVNVERSEEHTSEL